jgi:molybdopterin molybdotransferase
LTIVGASYAGRPYDGAIAQGECIAIMTGATMPDSCDTVVPQELTRISQTQVSISINIVQPGANRRFKGEDLRVGQVALEKGKILRPADLGLLASIGIANVPVVRRLRVAFFSTGDELRSLGEPLAPGCVYDSNRYTLHGMLTRLGCEVIDMGVVRDDPDALEAALRQACETADAIVTSGGVSIGAADYTKQVMAKLGQVAFWKINMRPGRPLAFGHIESNGHRAALFGLPGNPVAVMISFYFFARDTLLHMMGAPFTPLPLLRVPSTTAIRKKAGRTEYQRARLTVDSDGRHAVTITGAQGSGILRSMSEADGIIVLAHERGDIAAGDDVDVILFDGLV